MKLCIKYIDNDVIISKEYISSLEVENKNLFYRIVNDINKLGMNGNDSIYFYNGMNELNMINKIDLIIDYFNIDINNKTNSNNLNNYMLKQIDEKSYDDINKLYNKIKNIFINKFNDMDIVISNEDEFSLNNLIKLFKFKISERDLIVDKIQGLIDIQKEFFKDNLLIFVNLKQLLSKDELNEIYKYILYNQINVLFIDIGLYGICLENEKKLIIDNDLIEFML